jgi:hypothetical protein
VAARRRHTVATAPLRLPAYRDFWFQDGESADQQHDTPEMNAKDFGNHLTLDVSGKSPSRAELANRVLRGDFCGVCQVFLVQLADALQTGQFERPDEPDFVRYRHHESFEDLQASTAVTGCQICSLIRKSVSSANAYLEGGRIELHVPRINLETPKSDVEPGLDCITSGAWVVEVWVVKSGVSKGGQFSIADSVENPYVPARPVSKHYPDFGLCREWLRMYKTFHPACREGIANHVLPTRVLELGDGTPGEANSDKIRMIESCSLTGKINYAALSHCWGPIVPLRTTVGNYESHLVNIPHRALARNFRCAVQIAKELGLRCL